MYRIDKFFEYYNSLKSTRVQIEKDCWVHARPLPFYPGFLTKEYWKIRKQRKKDARAVRQGRAIAVTWENEDG